MNERERGLAAKALMQWFGDEGIDVADGIDIMCLAIAACITEHSRKVGDRGAVDRIVGVLGQLLRDDAAEMRRRVLDAG